MTENSKTTDAARPHPLDLDLRREALAHAVKLVTAVETGTKPGTYENPCSTAIGMAGDLYKYLRDGAKTD